jgi:hypothetical protein
VLDDQLVLITYTTTLLTYTTELERRSSGHMTAAGEEEYKIHKRHGKSTEEGCSDLPRTLWLRTLRVAVHRKRGITGSSTKCDPFLSGNGHYMQGNRGTDKNSDLDPTR